MRAVLGVLSILIVLAVLGVLARKHFGVTQAAPIYPHNPAHVDLSSPAKTLQVQSQQIQQQIKQSVEAGMQPRTMPDDEK